MPDPQSRKKKLFTKELMHWHGMANHRQLPWKLEQDPYRIWLSEIILQQTRAEQGLPYYLKFIEAYPTINDLAAATDDDAFRHWQGLGYYNRCRNMLETARYIVSELGGKFPDTYEGLKQLKGIGPYTAAAIGSFAYHLPSAVVDGNVYRVLARVFGIEIPFDTTEGKKTFQQLANELLEPAQSAAYNQAIMDLGATVCTPLSPVCGACPERKICTAFQEGLINYLPVRSKKQTVRQRYFHYLLLQHDGKLWVHKRNNSGIWQNLYEPFLIEADMELDKKDLILQETFPLTDTVADIEYEGSLSQRLTHQLINTRFFSVNLAEQPDMRTHDGKWVAIKDIGKLAFPKSILSFFEKKRYF